MRLQHKDGKIVDAPKAGVAALLALGWEPLDPPQEKPADGEAKDAADDAAESEDGEAKDAADDAAESEDGEAKAKPAAQKRGARRQVPKPGDDA